MVYHDAHEPRGMTPASARVLRWALEADASEVAVRRERAGRLHAAAAAGSTFRPIRPVTGATPGYLRFAAIDANGSTAPRPAIGMLRGYPMTLDEHPRTHSVLAAGEHAGAGARELRDRLFTFPTHSRMSAGDFSRVLTAIAGGRAGGDRAP
jgi:hypothetical protein